MTKYKFLAIIPARGGSKSIPKKNIVILEGRPLIAWTIQAAIGSKYISKTIVSSDDDEILSISSKLKASVIKRPHHLALDETPSEPVISHAIENLSSCGENFDYIAFLQPTSPLRNSNHIDTAIELLLSSNANALISIYEINNKVLKSFTKNDNSYIHGVVNDAYPFLRRQDLPKAYMSNGAIYLIKTEVFIHNRSLITDKTIGYEMNEIESIDIDSDDDLKQAAAFLKKIT